MFRIRDPQESLWQSQFLVTPKKAKRLERSWAEVFRNEALPLIDEERFAPMYCVDSGRPNRAVQTVLGVHLLKEMFNLTDDEALEQLEFNLLWHHALRLDIEETHLPQKTLPQLPSSPDAARLLPSWRSTGCWSGCCGSSAMWANTGTGAPGTMTTMLGNARCPWP